MVILIVSLMMYIVLPSICITLDPQPLLTYLLSYLAYILVSTLKYYTRQQFSHFSDTSVANVTQNKHKIYRATLTASPAAELECRMK